MQLELAERDPGAVLERRQVGLVMRVIEPVTGTDRGRQPRQPGPDAVPREVLNLAVVLM